MNHEAPEEPNLFNWRPDNFPDPQARGSDPETSYEAAADAQFHASRGRLLVLQNLRVEPLTDFELAERTGWQQTSIGKRRHECMEVGFVEVARIAGQVIKRPAPSGSAARVWRITPRGIAYLGL